MIHRMQMVPLPAIWYKDLIPVSSQTWPDEKCPISARGWYVMSVLWRVKKMTTSQDSDLLMSNPARYSLMCTQSPHGSLVSSLSPPAPPSRVQRGFPPAIQFLTSMQTAPLSPRNYTENPRTRQMQKLRVELMMPGNFCRSLYGVLSLKIDV